jgi:hypothetical protein
MPDSDAIDVPVRTTGLTRRYGGITAVLVLCRRDVV